MIKLHRKKSHPKSDTLEEKLKAMVISYEKKDHKSDEEGLPFIEEDGNKFVSESEIESWLNELRSELEWQRSLSGDGCYIHPESGKIC